MIFIRLISQQIFYLENITLELLKRIFFWTYNVPWISDNKLFKYNLILHRNNSGPSPGMRSYLNNPQLQNVLVFITIPLNIFSASSKVLGTQKVSNSSSLGLVWQLALSQDMLGIGCMSCSTLLASSSTIWNLWWYSWEVAILQHIVKQNRIIFFFSVR